MNNNNFNSSKDLVCGTVIRNSAAVAIYRYKDKSLYFCSAKCLNKFSKRPRHYLGKYRQRKLSTRMNLHLTGMKRFHPFSANVASQPHL